MYKRIPETFIKFSNLKNIAFVYIGLFLLSIDCCQANKVEVPGPRVENPSKFWQNKINTEQTLEVGEEEPEQKYPIDTRNFFDDEKEEIIFCKHTCKEGNLTNEELLKLTLKKPTLVLFFHGLGDKNNRPDFTSLGNNLMKIGGDMLFYELAQERPGTYTQSIKDQVDMIYPAVKASISNNKYVKIYLVGYSMGGLVANDIAEKLIEDDELKKFFYNIGPDSQKLSSKDRLSLITVASPIKGIDGQPSELGNFEAALNALVDKAFSAAMLGESGSGDAIQNLKNETKDFIKEELIENQAKKRLPGLANDPTQKGLLDLSRENCKSRKPADVETLHIVTSYSLFGTFIEKISKKVETSDVNIPIEVLEAYIRNNCRQECINAFDAYSKLLGCHPDVMEHDHIVPKDIQFYEKPRNKSVEIPIDHMRAPGLLHTAYEIVNYIREQEKNEELEKDFSYYSNLFEISTAIDQYIFVSESIDSDEIDKIQEDIVDTKIKLEKFENINDVESKLKSNKIKDLAIIISEEEDPELKSSFEVIASKCNIKRIRYLRKIEDSFLEFVAEYDFSIK